MRDRRVVVEPCSGLYYYVCFEERYYDVWYRIRSLMVHEIRLRVIVGDYMQTGNWHFPLREVERRHA